MSGAVDDPWRKYLPSGLPASAFSDLAQSMNYRPLNVQRLIDAGAIRITQPGSGTGPQPLETNDPNQWSLVTAYNDRPSDSYTRNWATRPESYASAIEAVNQPGLLYDGKYRQILWSAREAGLKPSDVFLPMRKRPAGLLGDVE